MSEELSPLVSICCITYNHESYIRQCLDGFLMQKTNFKYEILIHDDASTDATADIIREYELKYPEIIKPIYQTENQYSKGIKVSSLNYKRAKGEYIALCEGDDYWIEPCKLQKQVDFLENNPEYSLCFHRAKVIYDGEGLNGIDVFSHVKAGEYSLNYILHKWTVPTCSMVCRKNVTSCIPINPKFQYGDNVLLLTCFMEGRVFCIDGIYGVYRRNLGGWTLNKPQIKITQQQYIHTKALIESFPTLNLKYLERKNISNSSYLYFFGKKELPDDLKQNVKKDLKKFPILFFYFYFIYTIKQLKNNVLTFIRKEKK